jgi:hypothetical protein
MDAQVIDSVLITDSVGVGFHSSDLLAHPKLTCLSAAQLFGEAARRMVGGWPLAPLQTDWPMMEPGGGKKP